MAENLTNMGKKDINQHIYKAEGMSNRTNPNKSMPRYIIIKPLKTKTKKNILKEVIKKYLTFSR